MASADTITANQSEREGLLGTLADPTHPAISAGHVAVVVAHPDDETIGCGAQLRRLRDATVVVVTDGAPRNLMDAWTHGFPTVIDYAAARQRELDQALSIAGVAQSDRLHLGLPDQSAALHLAETALCLVDIFAARGITTVLTHAYEGGHPDHDAIAFAIHAAAALRRHSGSSLAIIEMPFYRLGLSGMIVQKFTLCADQAEIAVRLTPEEQALKQRMIAAYRTQRVTLAPFAADIERFRIAPPYDFSALSSEGQLYYERFPWGMSGEHWLALTRNAGHELGLGLAPWV